MFDSWSFEAQAILGYTVGALLLPILCLAEWLPERRLSSSEYKLAASLAILPVCGLTLASMGGLFFYPIIILLALFCGRSFGKHYGKEEIRQVVRVSIMLIAVVGFIVAIFLTLKSDKALRFLQGLFTVPNFLAFSIAAGLSLPKLRNDNTKI